MSRVAVFDATGVVTLAGPRHAYRGLGGLLQVRYPIPGTAGIAGVPPRPECRYTGTMKDTIKTYHAVVPTPLGAVLLCSEGANLTGLYFLDQKDCPAVKGVESVPARILHPSAGQVDGRPGRGLKPVHAPVQSDSGPHDSQAISARSTAGRTMPADDAHPGSGPESDRAGKGVNACGPAKFLEADMPAASRHLLQQTQAELAEYFAGRRQTFTVPLAPHGTVFQEKVWQALRAIPCGETESYAAVARRAGLTAAHSRATGAAVGHNPISILIPCHRVLAHGGTLNGYGGGLQRKARLLAIEGFTIR